VRDCEGGGKGWRSALAVSQNFNIRSNSYSILSFFFVFFGFDLKEVV
jgi:hypothetical protein